MTVDAPLVSVRGIAKTYPDGHVALRGIDLDIGEGMLGLLGPNGAGKTTLLSVLVMLREPTAGTRRYFGLDPDSASSRADIRQRIGFLPQDFSPIGVLTGLEYLAHCGRLRGLSDERALRQRTRGLLEAVGLASAGQRATRGYSGGMKRRLGIAQAFLHRPKLVVVDEPTSGLDPEERIRFRNLIADVAESTSVVLSTHVVEDVEATCPRLCIIAGGRLLFEGEPTELLRACQGQLWNLPDGAGLPDGALSLARRASASEDGGTVSIVLAAQRPPGSTPRVPGLEEAYQAWVARHGDSLA